MFPKTLVDSGEFILSVLTFMPLLGALALFFVEKNARLVSFITSIGTFLVSLILLKRFQPAALGFQFVENKSWLSAFNINFSLGVDGLSLWLIVLTTLLTVLVIIASGSIEHKLRSYLGFMLLLETGMIGTLLALDGVTFYIFWELMLVPMYFLIGVWGGARRIYAAIKFVLYTALGSLLMLVAIVYLAHLHQAQFGHLSFYLGDWARLHFDWQTEVLLFSAFALAFAIKVPIFPLHTWLPDAHVEAPTGGSVILAGVMLKMGLYGLIRFCIPIFPEATVAAAPLFATLGVIGIVYGSLVAWVQTDMKKLVAYSSVSHLGFCVLGFAAMNFQGMQGAILQMLNHGVSTAALFFAVGVLYDRKHTRMIADYGGLAAKVPAFAFIFLIFTLSSIGLPLTNGFIGEFLILLGGYNYSHLAGAVAVTGVVLGAMYMLSMYRRVMFGAFDAKKNGDLTDLNWREMAVFTPLVALVFIIGLFPQIILQVTAPAAETALAYLSVGKSKVAIAASQEGATLAPATVSQRPPKKLDVIRN